MRYAIAALIAAVVTVRVTTIYLLRRGRRSWVESGPGAGALTDEYDDWLIEFARPTVQTVKNGWNMEIVDTKDIPHLMRSN